MLLYVLLRKTGRYLSLNKNVMGPKRLKPPAVWLEIIFFCRNELENNATSFISGFELPFPHFE